MAKHIRKAALLLGISQLFFLAVPLRAQEGGFDGRRFLYGIHAGVSLTNGVDIYRTDAAGVAQAVERLDLGGGRFAVTGEMRLGRMFSLRVMPGVALHGLVWEPSSGAPAGGYRVESVCTEVPVDVKFHPFHWGDRRLYLTSGLGYSFDFTSVRRDADPASVRRLNAHDLRYTCGAGYEFDTRLLRLGVELRASFGLLPPATGGLRPDAYYFHNSGPTLSLGFNIEA